VAINGDAAPGDQAKVAVLGISLRRTMMMVWRYVLEMIEANRSKERKGNESLNKGKDQESPPMNN
jgi:hypothetical protein